MFQQKDIWFLRFRSDNAIALNHDIKIFKIQNSPLIAFSPFFSKFLLVQTDSGDCFHCFSQTGVWDTFNICAGRVHCGAYQRKCACRLFRFWALFPSDEFLVELFHDTHSIFQMLFPGFAREYRSQQ